MNEWTTSSKISIAAGCLILEGYQDKNEYDIFISTTHPEWPKGVSKGMLAKTWQISEYKARRAWEVTMQLNHQDSDSSLSRKLGTKDCMLWYKMIKKYFCCDTLWVIKISKIARGFTCIQLFASKQDFPKYMGWNLRKSSYNKLSYSAKRLETQQHLLLTLLELKLRMKFENFAKMLAEHYGSWNHKLSMLIELSYTLGLWKRASGRTIDEWILLIFYYFMLLRNDPKYWR